MNDEPIRPLSPEEKREQEMLVKQLYLLESNGMSARRPRHVRSGQMGRCKRKSAARLKVKR